MHFTSVVSAGLLAASAMAKPTTGRKRSVSGASSSKVVAYWGNVANNIPLATMCANEYVDTVILSFLTTYPEHNTKDNTVGIVNFGNACGWDQYGNGLFSCPDMADALAICRQNNKEVLLSVGGATAEDPSFSSQQVAINTANWIWKTFGANYPAGTQRPLYDFVIDGIDLDIEHGGSADQAYYSDFIAQLRVASGNTWKISGAPQCIRPDANMGTYIQSSWFDYIFVQLYNTADCSARNEIDHPSSSTNTFKKWLQADYANSNVQIFAGLPASTAASGSASYYLTPDEVKTLVNKYASYGKFGGVSLWDGTYDYNNQPYASCAGPYSKWVKEGLKQVSEHKSGLVLPGGVCPASSSSSSIMSSTSSVASSSSSSVVASTSSVHPTSSAVVSSSSSVVSSSSSHVVSSSVASSSSSHVVSSSSPVASSSSSAPHGGMSSSSSSAVVSSATSSGAPSSSAPHGGVSSSPSSSVVSSVATSSSVPHGGVSSSATSSFPHGGVSASPSSSVPHGGVSSSTYSSAPHGGEGHPTTSSSIADSHPTSRPPFSNSSSIWYGNGGGYGGSKPSSSPAGGYGGAAPSSKSYGGGEFYPKPSSSGAEWDPTKPSKSYGGEWDPKPTSSKAYGGGYGGAHPTATKTETTTYVDTCPTGFTTKTATYTRTCYEGDDESTYTKDYVPEGWTVTVTEYVPHNGAKPTPVTLTKPCDTTPADSPAKPTGGAWDGSYSKPAFGGDSGSWPKPVSTMVVVVTPVPAAEYSSYMQSKPKPTDAAPAGGYAKPSYAAGADAASSAVAKPVTGYSPSKAAGADSWPLASPVATGTKAGSYAPQFTGAASKMNVGLSLFAGVAVAAVAAF